MKKYFLLKPLLSLVIVMTFYSCKIEPQAIDYGKDQCSFCVMNIVDKTHASQYVTKKGKQFKFDAIECMVNDINTKQNEENLAFILVADYKNPGVMINAKEATYLISKEIKSPMGAYLSALSTKEKALALKQKHSGTTYTWKTLKQKFTDKN